MDHMLAQVNGVMNAVMVSGDAAGPTMYYGAGAGSGPTASAVIADVIDIVRTKGVDTVANLGFMSAALDDRRVVDISEITTSAYLRLIVADEPGVMARISTILSQHKISIEALIQKNAQSDHAHVVIITNDVLEKDLNTAMKELASLKETKGEIARIRVAAF